MKLNKFHTVLSVLISIISLHAFSATPNRPVVSLTDTQKVVGVERHGVNEYRGIPYGVAQRWASPKPAPAWQGMLDAENFGPACPQQARFGLTEGSNVEDCLSINVSTPKDIPSGQKLPVFIWIHGGAFVGGSSNLYRLDQLARAGRLVVVSMNYRLGALGFMPHPAFASNHVNGNYGLEDQRLAMRWVQQHIEAFGGDKHNVTLAGESAGGGSVCMHLSSPDQVSGLFHKAITQSAGCMAESITVTDAQAPGKASARLQEALCPATSNPSAAAVLACMRSKTVDDILKQQGSYTSSYSSDITPFWPVTGDPTANPPVVNATVPASFKYAAAHHKLVNVPMIIGGTKDELALYVGYYWQGWKLDPANNKPINNQTIDSFWLPASYPGRPEGSTQTYASLVSAQYSQGLHSSDPNVVAQTFGTVLSDYNPKVGINNCVYLQTANVLLNYRTRLKQTQPLYQFEFADAAAPVCRVGIAEPCPSFQMGAVHSSELNYMFPNLSNTAAINAPDLPPASQALSDQMVRYWSQFAYTGNPNSAGLPHWPLYAGADTPSVMLFKPGRVGPVNADALHQCTAFWGKHYNLAY